MFHYQNDQFFFQVSFPFRSGLLIKHIRAIHSGNEFSPEMDNYSPEVDNYSPEMDNYSPEVDNFHSEMDFDESEWRDEAESQARYILPNLT